MDMPQFQYAGFWKRFVAYIIDQIIVGIASLVLLVPFFALIGVSAFTMHDEDLSYDSEAAISVVIALIAAYITLIAAIWICQWLYYALMESSSYQGTLGKMALGIKVTDMNGNGISFGRATGRYFAKIISSLTLCIGYIIAGFTQQKQALHDIIASCLVVNK
ncbi:MAG: RDD family protein [Bacteroidota bacterium]